MRGWLGREVEETGGRVHTVEFGIEHAKTDLVARIAEAAWGVDCLFVVGLDRLLIDANGESRRTSAVANLNQRRDALPRVVDARAVLWVSRDAEGALRDQAWDLHEVMLTVAELDGIDSVEDRGVG